MHRWWWRKLKTRMNAMGHKTRPGMHNTDAMSRPRKLALDGARSLLQIQLERRDGLLERGRLVVDLGLGRTAVTRGRRRCLARLALGTTETGRREIGGREVEENPRLRTSATSW